MTINDSLDLIAEFMGVKDQVSAQGHGYIAMSVSSDGSATVSAAAADAHS